MKKNGFTLVELLVIVAIVAILGAMVFGLSGGCSVSDGTRSGVLQKFSHKGLVNKSYEGELLLGGLKSTDNGTTANTWDFSVMDADIAKRLEGLVGQHVTIKYHQTFTHNPLSRDSSYLAVEVSTNSN